MKTEEDLIWENYLMEKQTRGSENEIKYYMEEIFGDTYSNLNFIKPEKNFNNPKFENIIFTFIYKERIFVKVISGPGVNASKSKNASLSVSIYLYENYIKKGKWYDKETNAFYNESTENVDYDPIITNGEDLLIYVKSFLDRDDRDTDSNYTPTPEPPIQKQTPSPVYA